jgi:hypothetical protein
LRQLRLLAEGFVWCALLATPSAAIAEPVAVRHTEGLVHGFLALHALDGRKLADGELIQNSRNGRVTSRLVFRFVDGSLHDETVTFTQSGHFRMLSDHVVQKGPAFPHPLEAEIDGRTGNVVVTTSDEHGAAKRTVENVDVSPDISNGLILTLMKNIRPDVPRTTVSMVAFSPKPRLVKLVISPAGEEPFATGGMPRKAVRFVVHIEIGGVAGVVAPLVGKQPPDTHVWVLEGEAPAFVKSEGSLAMDAEPWRIELVSPTWPKGE